MWSGALFPWEISACPDFVCFPGKLSYIQRMNKIRMQTEGMGMECLFNPLNQTQMAIFSALIAEHFHSHDA